MTDPAPIDRPAVEAMITRLTDAFDDYDRPHPIFADAADTLTHLFAAYEAEKARADDAEAQLAAISAELGIDEASTGPLDAVKNVLAIVAKQDAQLSEARAALQPFADCYSSFSPLEFDTSPVDIHGPLNLNVGDLRRARDAITEEPTP